MKFLKKEKVILLHQQEPEASKWMDKQIIKTSNLIILKNTLQKMKELLPNLDNGVMLIPTKSLKLEDFNSKRNTLLWMRELLPNPVNLVMYLLNL